MVRYKVFRVEIKKEETATVRYAGRKGLLLQAKSANANPPSKYIAHSGAIIMPRIYILQVYFFFAFFSSILRERNSILHMWKTILRSWNNFTSIKIIFTEVKFNFAQMKSNFTIIQFNYTPYPLDTNQIFDTENEFYSLEFEIFMS